MTVIVAVYLPDSPLHIRSVYSMPTVAKLIRVDASIMSQHVLWVIHTNK